MVLQDRKDTDPPKSSDLVSDDLRFSFSLSFKGVVVSPAEVKVTRNMWMVAQAQEREGEAVRDREEGSFEG